MSLLKRFIFYFGGFALSLIFLFFIKEKIGFSFEFDYGPNSRTLKNIRLKNRVFSESALNELQKHQLDTSDISFVLLKGDVIFNESNIDLDSCKVYVIEGEPVSEKNKKVIKNIKMTIQNCNKTATVQKLIISE